MLIRFEFYYCSNNQIKILKCIEKDTYIVADESKIAILSTSGRLWLDEDLTTGYWYILMRCTKGEEKHEVKCHKLFKLIKIINLLGL